MLDGWQLSSITNSHFMDSKLANYNPNFSQAVSNAVLDVTLARTYAEQPGRERERAPFFSRPFKGIADAFGANEKRC